MRGKPVIAAVSMLAVMALLLRAQTPDNALPSGVRMIQSAQTFRALLTPAQLQQASFGFNDPERLNWHFIPRERKGLPLRDLQGPALKAAHDLLKSGLSDAGYDQVMNVMSLEEVLYLLEGGEREYRRERRHPGKYYLSFFGEPTQEGTWGWRVEGHHLSLNFTVEKGRVVSSTPEFYGANPGTVEAGQQRQIRILGREEDLARSLFKLCDSRQQALCWVSKVAPDEVPGPNEPQPVVNAAAGLPFSQMSEDQRQLLRELLSEYLRNLPADVEQARRQRINDAGLDGIHFAWLGDPDLHQRHHYRIQGPTFIIEYNNTQNNANHVHSMWRDVAGDFNIPRK